MSYCRFSDGDVYAYDSVEGGVMFYVRCGFDKGLERLCMTYNEAYQYAKELRDAHGLNVPNHAIEALKADAIEEAERINGPKSAIAEVLAENAKLRELVKDLNKWLWNGADCTECPFTAKCDLNAAFESDLHAHICIGWSEIHDRMRELGIEVPE